jgi:hypothetical protein
VGGVEAYDYDRWQKFSRRIAYLWSVNDFKSYNIFLGCSWNEILSCLRGRSLTLIVIDVFYSPGHPFRLDRNTFKKDIIVLEGLPRRLTVQRLLICCINWSLMNMGMSL